MKGSGSKMGGGRFKSTHISKLKRFKGKYFLCSEDTSLSNEVQYRESSKLPSS
jgi:hypothetical protein